MLLFDLPEHYKAFAIASAGLALTLSQQTETNLSTQNP